jgi:RNA polymerase sigma-70 factor (ECF subfamily)
MRMEEAPATRASLLVRIRDGNDQAAWQQFIQMYAPVVYRYARNRGLQDADAADLMQDVFRSIANTIGRWNYDPARGKFRGWLFTITRNKIFSFLESRRRRAVGSGDSDVLEQLESQPAPDDQDELWDREYERRLFGMAAEQVRGEFTDQTWKAFWQTAVDGKNPKDVARALGMSPGAVYVAKSRVLARLREQVAVLQEE